jgi:molecular chaperone GrpE
LEPQEEEHGEVVTLEEAAPSVMADTEEPVAQPETGAGSDLDEWRGQALRLQAEMDNYRKRQRRLARDQVEQERQRLLGAFLNVVDNLERALDAPAGDAEGLRQGVRMIHREAVQLLENEGAEEIEAVHQPFDPHYHEAIATVARNGSDVESNRVVQVVEKGYSLGDQLLRPARVVVAV